MASHDGPLNIPCKSLASLMTERFDQLGDSVALIESASDRQLTFCQLSDKIRRLTRGLASLGFKKGDVLCMFSPNLLEYPVVFYAVASLGGVLQATNPLYTATELQHAIDLCKCKFLVTIPALLPTVKNSQCDAQIIVIGDAEGCISYSSLLTEKFSNDPISDQDIDPKEDVVAILFSSGTTGKPKAVQITHYSFVANVLQLLAPVDPNEKHCYVTFLPFFHIYGLSAILACGLYHGSKNVIMSRFQPQEYLNNIQKYKASILHVVPPVLVLFSRMPDIHQYDLSSVKEIACGAAPLSKDVEKKILELFNIKFILQGYGMTECQISHVIRKGNFKFGSAGLLLPGVECKIIDLETSATVADSVDGEVCIRGPGVMKGYLSDPGATAAVFDDDGWIRTGDIGHVDSEGFLFIVDRLKELIKYKGFQVAPAELEDILLSHPGVADVGVIGVPDVEAGELPKAFVVKKPGSEITEDELRKFVEGKVSGPKRLRGGVTFLTQIPKSASGKILRRVLRDMEKSGDKQPAKN